MKVNKLIVSSFAFVAIFVVSSNAYSRAPPCTKTKADCVNMQAFDKYACECYCPYGRRGPSWGCDSNKFWDRTNCDCACKATVPAAGCGLGEWNKERCACHCPRPESPTPSGKTWARHPTCAYVCRNPKPANLPAFKQWNEDKCRVECIPTKPDPIPAGKRWCEDCCELACIAKPPCSLAIPANKQWSTDSCSVVCKDSAPLPADTPANKQWNSDICALECKDSPPDDIPTNKQWSTDSCTVVCRDAAPGDIPTNKQWDESTCALVCKDSPPGSIDSNKQWSTESCTVVCRDSAPDPVPTGQQWNSNTCALESSCTLTASSCIGQQTFDVAACSCKCATDIPCAAGTQFNAQFCDCFSNSLPSGGSACLSSRIVSTSGCFYLTRDATGNYVLYKRDGTALWGTQTTDGTSFCLINGNIFVEKDRTTLWKSTPLLNPGTKAVLQDSGNFQILDDAGAMYWQSNTAQSVTTC